VNGGYVYEAEEGEGGDEGLKGMERIGQYCPEECSLDGLSPYQNWVQALLPI